MDALGVKTVEIKEMPTKELLERFMSQMVLGTAVEVSFDIEKGKFEDLSNYTE